MEWDYFKPNPSEYCKSASKRYVDTRDDTVLKTALAKVAELNKEEQADWNETDTRKASYIKNKPNIPSLIAQSDWAQTNPAAQDFIKNKPTLADVATSGDYEDLSNTPSIPTVPTNVSEFVNDAGYQTSGQVTTAINTALSGYTPATDLATVATSGDYNDLENLPIIPEGSVLYPTTGAHTDGAMTQKATTDALATKANVADLSAVATTGNYDDLDGKYVFTLQTTDPGAGGTLAANNFIVVYEA